MASTAFTSQTVTLNGSKKISWTAADITNGNKVIHATKQLIIVENTDGSNSLTVTISSPTNSQNMSGSEALTLAAGETGTFSPLDTEWATSGYTEIAFSGSSTSANIAALRFYNV